MRDLFGPDGDSRNLWEISLALNLKATGLRAGLPLEPAGRWGLRSRRQANRFASVNRNVDIWSLPADADSGRSRRTGAVDRRAAADRLLTFRRRNTLVFESDRVGAFISGGDLRPERKLR
jgi:hypothetical protein